MSRRKAARRSRPGLKLHVEPLEARWLLNADGRRPERAGASTASELLREAHPDAGTFAHELARHPRLADGLGLGALARALRRHASPPRPARRGRMTSRWPSRAARGPAR